MGLVHRKGFHHLYPKTFIPSITFYRERVAQGEHKVGELALFQLSNQPLELVLGKLASLFFKDSFRGLGRRRVKEHYRRHFL